VVTEPAPIEIGGAADSDPTIPLLLQYRHVDVVRVDDVEMVMLDGLQPPMV